KLYDEALSLRPTQREALLGRTMMLAYLHRYDEAIATATRMLDLGTWYLGDAYYWRAWSKYYGGALHAAALDVASAKGPLPGMIAYDQRRRTDARADFNEAIRRYAANCTAQSYLGRIDADDTRWR